MNIALRRLASQHLTGFSVKTVAALVRHMTALQAQDAAMARWAVGIRLPGSTDAAVRQAIDRGEIIRTHLLRPTWHLVAAGDLRWMVHLTAPHIIRSMASRHRELEITPALETKSMKVIAAAIESRGPLTREELGQVLEPNRVDLRNNRLWHLLMLAELRALICSGPVKGGKQTYALVDDRVPAEKPRERSEACIELVRRYMVSHGPATLRDVVWWSGLPVGDVRRAIGDLGDALCTDVVDGETYWSAEDRAVRERATRVHLLPAYDEFLIAYADRSASLPASMAKGVVSSNGIFRAVISVNGSVVGLWTRTLTSAGVRISLAAPGGARPPAKKNMDLALSAYADFIGTPLVR